VPRSSAVASEDDAHPMLCFSLVNGTVERFANATVAECPHRNPAVSRQRRHATLKLGFEGNVMSQNVHW
jgi:hypothetical protein